MEKPETRALGDYNDFSRLRPSARQQASSSAATSPLMNLQNYPERRASSECLRWFRCRKSRDALSSSGSGQRTLPHGVATPETRQSRNWRNLANYLGVDGTVEEWWSTISQRSPFLT